MAPRKPDSQAPALQLKGADRNLSRFVVPRAITQHPLVATRDFYTLPARLLNSIVEHVGQDRFDAQLLEMERQLSALVGDHSVYVGIRREAPIAYGHLEPPQALAFSFDDVKHLGWNMSEQEFREFQPIANPRLETVTAPIRGYCGWLMTNGTYVAEHDQLIRQHADRIREYGFPKPVLAVFGAPLPESPSDEPWVRAFRVFYSRWRLQSLVGPGLPVPLPIGIPTLPAVAGTLAAAEGGTMIFLPDFLPVPVRGILPESIDDAVHGRRSPDHLAEWHHIIRRKNPAKNAIPRYARLFSLQHFSRIVHARHPAAVHRNGTRLTSAFATFFDVSDDSIRKDLTLLKRRLGKGWERRPDPFA